MGIQRKLLAETTLTLDKPLSTARAIETVEKDMRALKKNSRTTKQMPIRETRRCGATTHSATDRQWKMAVCHACKKRGHLARICQSKPPPHSTNGVDVETRQLPGDTEAEGDEDNVYAIFTVMGKKDPISWMS